VLINRLLQTPFTLPHIHHVILAMNSYKYKRHSCTSHYNINSREYQQMRWLHFYHYNNYCLIYNKAFL